MDLNEIISSLSAEDINRLKEVAATILPNENAANNNDSENNILSQVGQLSSAMGADDDKTALIRALKPMLSPQRQQKADEAIKLMRLIRLLPTLRDSGILKNLL